MNDLEQSEQKDSHTPTPWIQRGESVVANKPMMGAYSEESVLSLVRPPNERLANAALIVGAVNSYESLKSRVHELEGALKRLWKSSRFVPTEGDCHKGFWTVDEDVLQEARAALKKGDTQV